MIKLFVAFVAALIATPAVAQNVPTVVVMVDSVLPQKADHQLLTVHKDGKSIDVTIVGCPVAKAGSPYYLIAVPTVGMFMVDKAVMDKAYTAEGGDFAKASHDVITANAMCVVTAAKETQRI